MLRASVLVLSILAASPLPAAVDDYYSQGVNAFFAGRLYDSDVMLSEAITADGTDPLPYYFRALAKLRTGCEAEARGDMWTGAQLEATHGSRSSIGAALQRIQGWDRLLLEKYRREARAAAIRETPAAAETPSMTTDRDAEVLRERIVLPLDELSRPAGPQEVPATPMNVLPEQTEPADRADAPEGAAAPAAAEPDPFGDDAAAPAESAPANEDAMPVESAAPAAVPPQETETAPADTAPAEESDAPKEDPFSDL
jgi:hypothetical protein